MPYTPELVAKEEHLGLPRAADSTPPSRIAWPPVSAIAILLAVLYYRVALKLVYDWYTIPDYSPWLSGSPVCPFSYLG